MFGRVEGGPPAFFCPASAVPAIAAETAAATELLRNDLRLSICSVIFLLLALRSAPNPMPLRINGNARLYIFLRKTVSDTAPREQGSTTIAAEAQPFATCFSSYEAVNRVVQN
jgi:hypothetical protein